MKLTLVIFVTVFAFLEASYPPVKVKGGYGYAKPKPGYGGYGGYGRKTTTTTLKPTTTQNPCCSCNPNDVALATGVDAIAPQKNPKTGCLEVVVFCNDKGENTIEFNKGQEIGPKSSHAKAKLFCVNGNWYTTPKNPISKPVTYVECKPCPTTTTTTKKPRRGYEYGRKRY